MGLENQLLGVVGIAVLILVMTVFIFGFPRGVKESRVRKCEAARAQIESALSKYMDDYDISDATAISLDDLTGDLGVLDASKAKYLFGDDYTWDADGVVAAHTH